MSRILMVAPEVAPFAKTGGLADVTGALPAALRKLGHEVAVLLPRYRETMRFPSRKIWDWLPVRLGATTYETSVYLVDDQPGVYLLHYAPFFDRDELYGEGFGDYPDNHLRFGLLCRAAFEFSRSIFLPELIHCHDWQTGLIPLLQKAVLAGDPTFIGIRTLFTIHNLGFQGLFPASALAELGLPRRVFRPEGAEFWGNLSFLKAGLVYSDALNTVSPTYAREIQTPEYGFGMDGVLHARGVAGILNGADYTEWSPETDAHLPAHYSASDLAGKRICKQALLQELGLPEAAIDRPLLGIVSRFTNQKGFDLITSIVGSLFQENVYVAALGSGDPEHERTFQALAKINPDRVSVTFAYDDALAHRIMAGSDMLLMPSRYEPCGLTQIYGLRYGTIPVVRATGGLDDTIEAETGFKFVEYSGPAFLAAIRSASALYGNPSGWERMMRQAMSRDFSWNLSAQRYSDLYKAVLNPTAG